MIERRLFLVLTTIAILQYFQQQYEIAQYKKRTAIIVYQPFEKSRENIICNISENSLNFNCRWQYTCSLANFKIHQTLKTNSNVKNKFKQIQTLKTKKNS